MRADVKRFAAHKAHYVHRKLQEIDTDTTIPTDQKETYKEQAMRTFHRWGEAEYNYAVQSTQMAEQWENFAKDGDRYYLQYRTAADEKVRAEHAILHNTTLPIDDPFWQQFMPPNGWNCRCTVVQVRKDKYAPTDSTTAYQAGEAATSKQPSFRFNPGATKTCFPDNVSYYKHANNQQRKEIRTYFGKKVLNAESKQTLKGLQGSSVQVPLQGGHIEVIFDSKTTSHVANDITIKCSFLGNELIKRLADVLPQCRLVAYEPNTKLDSKPSAVTYWYYEYRQGKNVLYFNIEENFVSMGNRHFYRLYAITETLRDSVIKE